MFVQVRVREFYIAMQRCPYIHEMKERLLGAPPETPDTREAREAREARLAGEGPRDRALEQIQDTQVGTIVKVRCHPHHHYKRNTLQIEWRC